MFDWHEIGAMTRAVAAALAVHVLMAALVVIGTMDWQPFRKPQPTHIAIEAVIVDTSEIRKQRDEARQAMGELGELGITERVMVTAPWRCPKVQGIIALALSSPRG